MLACLLACVRASLRPVVRVKTKLSRPLYVSLISCFNGVRAESSTSKKRKKRAVEQTAGVRTAGPSPKRSRIDAVLDRAISCLKKIQELKSSLR